MAVIPVEGGHSIAELEALYPQLGPDTELLVPTELTHRMLGGDIALIQLLITWTKRNPNAYLRTYVRRPEDAQKQLAKLVRSDHGLIALLRAADIRTRDGKHSLKADAGKLVNDRLAAMRSTSVARRGAKVFLTCAYGPTEFLPPLYYPTKEDPPPVRDESGFALLARELLSMTAGFYSSVERTEATVMQFSAQIGLILRELFKNTHDWARKDLKNIEDPHSIRGIRFEVHQSPLETVKSHVTESPALEAYLSQPSFRAVDRTYVRFLEISVFDSGPGLAARFRAHEFQEDAPISDEYAAVLDCLAKHGTSSNRTHRGLGLYDVMRVLSELKGFLRIRTGRLNLQRDFLAVPYAGALDPRQPTTGLFLNDWCGTRDAKPHEEVTGALITLFVPITTT